ncbi:MAG: UDP-3-O-(3-hydroxymyristoyl)glucosamine N-acyltransferase [Chthoniobacterales bacterium]
MLTVAELADRVGGEYPPESAAVSVTGPASLADARPGEVSFFAHPRYVGELRTTRASAVLVPRDFAGETASVPVRVDNPSRAFTEITALFIRPPVSPPAGVHPAAQVHEGASIDPSASVCEYAVVMPGATVGPRSIVGAGSYVGRDARLGADCLLHPHAVVREDCQVGDRVILHCGVVVGSDGFGYDTKDGRHCKIPQSGRVVIGNDVEIGANTTIDRARFGRTVIGEGTKIDNLVMIAHNVVIGRHCIICAQVGISGSTQIGDYVVLAGQAGLVGHIKVGDGAIVGAQSGLSNDLAPKAIVVGSPPRPIGDWKRAVVRIDKLGQLYERVRKLEKRAGGES